MQNTATKVIDWSEQGLVPDTVIRHGIGDSSKQTRSAALG